MDEILSVDRPLAILRGCGPAGGPAGGTGGGGPVGLLTDNIKIKRFKFRTVSFSTSRVPPSVAKQTAAKHEARNLALVSGKRLVDVSYYVANITASPFLEAWIY